MIPRPSGVKHVETSDLRKAGLKITLPRLKILEILGRQCTLPTARRSAIVETVKHEAMRCSPIVSPAGLRTAHLK